LAGVTKLTPAGVLDSPVPAGERVTFNRASSVGKDGQLLEPLRQNPPSSMWICGRQHYRESETVQPGTP